MKKMGFSNEQVQTVTGLPAETIKKDVMVNSIATGAGW
jgi:hypothetical protein